MGEISLSSSIFRMVSDEFLERIREGTTGLIFLPRV